MCRVLCDATTSSKAASVPWIVRRFLIVESWVESQVVACANCVVHGGTGRGFLPSTSLCPRLHHSADNP